MNSLYGNFRTRTFSEIFPTADEFNQFYHECGLFSTGNTLQTQSVYTIYYLLLSNYADSNISSSDENFFKYQIMSTIFSYGLSWEKKLSVQSKLRALTDDDIINGTISKYTKALYPGKAPGANTDPFDYANEFNKAEVKKGKVQAYAELYALIEDDLTTSFMKKFKKFFLQIVLPELPLWYATYQEEGEEE